MIFLGHIGITIAAIKTYENIFKNKEMCIDYRTVILGSILPDLIDKPIAYMFTRNLLHGGKLFGHTLVFPLILIIIGIIYYLMNRRFNILLLGMCSLIHGALDLMWVFPETYLYPFYSSELTLKLNTKNLPYYAKLYYSRQGCFFTEIVGLLILFRYFYCSIKKKSFRSFTKSGRLFDR